MAIALYNSLVLGGAIELWGPPGGVPSINPMCPGATFRVQPGYDLNAPQPTTDFIASLILDGERPFGDRASDRTITLPVLIEAPDFRTLAGARELLMATIDAQQWTLTWTRATDGADPQSYPLVLDCFRAQPSVIQWGGPDGFNLHPIGKIALKFQALPYGRSDTQQQVAFAAPVAALNSPGAPPAPVVLDAFSTINSVQCQQSSQCVVGPNSCYWDPGHDPFDRDDGQNAPLVYGASFPAPLNLTGMTSLSVWLGLGSRYYYNHHPRGRTQVTLAFTLTDDDGVRLSWSARTKLLPVSQDPQAPSFTRVSVRIPANSATFDYSTVTAYTLTITNRAATGDSPGGEMRWTCVYLDALTAYPSSQVTVAPSPRGSVYTLHGVAGTHRAPASMQFQQAPAAGTPSTITAAGAGTYTVPAGAVYLKVECIGGGGAGAQMAAAGQAGGGGGAEYAAELQFPVTPGQLVPYLVGSGGTDGATPVAPNVTVFGPAPNGSLTVTANPGGNAVPGSAAGGAGGTGSTNSVRFPGGAGRTASGGYGGGGGGSGGSASPGNVPVGTGIVLFTSGSGNWTCPPGVTSVLAECWGGGGGGGNSGTGDNGGGGAGGEYAAQMVAVTPGNSYAYVAGAGGAGNSGGGPGSAGAASTFTGDAATVTAHAGAGGISDDPAQTTRAQGGTGSTNTTHWNGGAGGLDDPYCGGGGSSAGPAAAGNTGGSPGGAVAPTGGGNGGASSGSGTGNGTAGSAPGGGGGGCQQSGYSGGAGAAGQVRLTYPGGAGAPTNNGATAVTGGGAGGLGGGTPGTAGSAGSAPGGGGGGANSVGTTIAGGAGGTGKITITPYTSPAFKTLIVHRPSRGAPPQLNPFVPVGGGLSPPGATEYAVPTLVSGINPVFGGTYTVILTNTSWDSPTAARTISVTVRQYEYSGGAHYDTTTTPITITPSTQVTNGIVVAGVLTLPARAIPPDNTGAYFTVLVSDTDGADRFYDCLFLDTEGGTIAINEPTTGYINYYIDEPDATTDLGRHMGSQYGRPSAVSVMDACMAISGGPLTLEPGSNTLLCYAQEGAPSIALSYFSRYYAERLE